MITKATLADAFALRAPAHRAEHLARPGHPAGELGAPSVDRIPILRMGDFLLVTIQVDMHDRLATDAAGRPHHPDQRDRRRAAC